MTDQTPNAAALTLASLSAFLAVTVGAMVLAGWAFDIVALKSILPGWVPMKPNAAVCFILTGISLLLTTRPSIEDFGKTTSIFEIKSLRIPHSAFRIGLARVFGLLAGLIGLLTLGEYMFGWNPGIDQWLFREPVGTAGVSHPSRMAPEAALCFVFLSMALWITGSLRQTSSVIHARWTTLVSLSLSLLVVAIALAGILSYAALDLSAYGWFGLTIMAMHAALLFAMLGMAVIAINWQQDGLQWAFSRNVTAAFVCGLALLVFIGFTTNRSQFWIKKTNRQIAHTEEIQGDIGDILTEVVDAQVHASDYALTGDERFMKSYLLAKATSNTKLDALHRGEFVSTESIHQQHFARIEAQVKAQLQWLQQIIDASRTGMDEAARDSTIIHGEDLLDNLRSTFAQIESAHRQSIEQLKQEAESVARFSYLIAFTGTLASLLIFLSVMLRLNVVANRSKRADEVLRDSEVQYRTMIENSNDMIWTLAPDGRFTFINQQAADVTDRSIEDWLGKTFEPLVVEEDLPMVLEMHGKIMSGEKVHYEVRGKKADGGILALSVNASPIFKDGKVSGTISFANDITARKQMEKDLRESEARYRRITDGLTDYQYTVRIENGRAVEATQSTACMTVTGYTAEEFAANPDLWLQMVVAEDRERVREHVRQILSGQDVSSIEHHITRKDGEIRWICDTTILFKDASGKLLSYDGVIKDISERKQAEATIQHANRALATLSAVNSQLVHATDEDELLQAICDAIVQQRGYRMAWVGYVQHDESKSIKIMAHAGHDEGYLDAMQLTWAETDHGMGTSGRAVRSGTTQLCQFTANDPLLLPWRAAALHCGFAASIALPLLNGDHTAFGILSVYAAEVNAFSPTEVDLLEEMAGDLAFGVHTLHTRHERDLALVKNQEQFEQLQDSLEDTVQAIAAIVEMRDPYLAGHQSRVADLAVSIARQMGLPDEQVHAIHLAGVLHDLGKIKIPAEILSKPGRITDIELSLIKIHPKAGHDILKNITFPWPIAQIVLQHHERLDGSGYPQGLKNDQILIEARILGVADVVESMFSHRPYRAGLGIGEALGEITRQRGSHFDPQVVDACLAVFREQGFSFK